MQKAEIALHNKQLACEKERVAMMYAIELALSVYFWFTLHHAHVHARTRRVRRVRPVSRESRRGDAGRGDRTRRQDEAEETGFQLHRYELNAN